MTRGIVHVVALLVIASAFSQFSGPSGLVLSSANPPANSSPAPSSPVDGAGKPSTSEKVDCKDLLPCIPVQTWGLGLLRAGSPLRSSFLRSRLKLPSASGNL